MMVRKFLAATAMSLLAGSAANAEWYQASSKHFVVYSDDTADHLRDYTGRLERFDRAVRLLHVDRSPERGDASRVIVYVLPGVGDIEKLQHGAAGFWQPRTVPVAFMPRNAGGEASNYGFTPQVIMFHEYTHHWMLTSWSDAAIPTWYAEGAAEMHATAMIRPDGSVIFGAVPSYRSYGISRKNQMPVSRLLKSGEDHLSPEDSEALYARGWLLTHYLTFDADRRKMLSDYLGAINSGQTTQQAARILGDPSSLDFKLDSWAKRPKVASITIAADQIQVGEVAIRKLTAAEAAAMPATIRSNAGVDKNSAPTVLAMARKAAAAFPNDAATQNELAEAEYDAASLGPKKDTAAGYARAEAAADRAIAADPKSIHALIYKGMAKEAVAVDAERTDAATWAEVRRWYLAANRADTESAEPLIHFYESFGKAKQKPTPGADRGLLYAYALAPHDINARLLATKVLLQQGKPKEARIAIAPVAYRADLGEGGEKLRKVLAALDDKGADAALAEIKKMEDDAEAKRKDADKKRA